LPVSPQGKKVWIAMYDVRSAKRGEKPTTVMETIASLAVMPKLEDARERARASIMKARDGLDPRLGVDNARHRARPYDIELGSGQVETLRPGVDLGNVLVGGEIVERAETSVAFSGRNDAPVLSTPRTVGASKLDLSWRN
jgi:hypothetical protein